MICEPFRFHWSIVWRFSVDSTEMENHKDVKWLWNMIISQLFFEIEVNSGKIFTEPRSGEVNIPKATIHRDWKE